MPTAYNDVGVVTATTGTGSMTLGAAINNSYLTEVEAGVPNAAVISYIILQGTDIEAGRGTYTAAGRTLSRDTVTFSKIGGTAGTTKITLNGSAQVRLIQLAADFVPIERSVSAGTGLTGGGDLSANRSLALTVPVAAVNGGTAQTTYTLGDILYSNAANSLAKLAGQTTTAKQYLSQTGTGSASAAPAWGAIAGADVTGAALTKADDTNVTLTLGGTPATAMLRATSITVAWTGVLAPGRGGTGVANNAASTITISGAFPLTFTLSAGTSLTLPTSGTLLNNARQVISGGGLTGGGDLSADRTLAVGAGTGIAVNADDVALNFNALTEDTAPDQTADFLATYDTSAATHKKVRHGTIAREKLTASRTYYVRTDGNNSNTGLVDSAGGAFQTIQRAIDVVWQTLDICGNTVIIQVRNGTYAGGIVARGPAVGLNQSGTVLLQGDTITPSNVVISTNGGYGVSCQEGARLAIAGFKGVTTGTGSFLRVETLGFIDIVGKLDFGANAWSAIYANAHGVIRSNAQNHNITGGAFWFIWAEGQGQVQFFGASTVTLSGSPVFSLGFAYAHGLSNIFIGNSITWSGSTGAGSKRYDVTGNSVVDVSGGATTYLPGDTAGTTASGGQYV